EQDNIAFNAQAGATNLCGDIDCQEKNEQSDSDSEMDCKMDEQSGKNSDSEKSSEVDEQGGKDSKVNAVGNSEQSDCNDKGDCKDTQSDDENESVEICENVWKEKVDKFFLENPKAQPFAKEIAQEMLDDKCLVNDANGLETAFSRFLVKSYKSPSELTASDEFLSRYVFSSEAIKNRIIEDYLFSLSHQKPPATIKGTGTTTLTPPSRPKTLQEAGWIFIRDNK
ncbi:MAG TPA: hypothetical protein VJZ69_02070, partial [Clostridia bacterium]|nr:hypothetical protein [Clostridia bacterium]